MSSQKPSPKNAARLEREERLAAQLRENLKRRKAQARARSAEENEEGSGEDNIPGDPSQ
jgi:hypothetical protein